MDYSDHEILCNDLEQRFKDSGIKNFHIVWLDPDDKNEISHRALGEINVLIDLLNYSFIELCFFYFGNDGDRPKEEENGGL